MKWRRLSAVVTKELRQLARDRITLAMIAGIPVIQLVVFGFAINFTLRHLPTAVADQAKTSGSRQLVMDMLATDVITPVTDAHSPSELMSLLRRGEIDVGIAIPPDFERRKFEGRPVAQVLVDGSDTSVQAAAAQLAQVPVGTPSRGGGSAAAQEAQNEVSGGATAATPRGAEARTDEAGEPATLPAGMANVPTGTASLDPARSVVILSESAESAELHREPGSAQSTTPRVGPISVVSFYNPDRRSSVFIVPGLIGVILTMTMVLFTAVAVVRERERGNMELLIATPITRAELMIGKVLPYIAIGLVQTTVVLALGIWLFDVPIRGSVLDVYIAAALLIVANLSLGLLISTRAQSQFQAMQMTFFVFLPSMLLSGFMFPFGGLPKVVQWLAEMLPLTHFVRLIRGVMLRGASIGELWPDVAELVGFTVIMMAVAILRFRKRLD